MCGRFTIAKEKEEVLEFLNKQFEIDSLEDIELPRYNVGPGQDILAVLYDGQKYRAGLIPWNYQIKYQGKLKPLINARGETIEEKYSFKKAFENNRCLIVTDGFYEWDEKSKQPYRIVKKDEGLMFYAGIYESFTKDGQKHFGSLIITTKANDLIKEHHHRMPVIFDSEQAKSYLDPTLSLEEIKVLIEPYPQEKLMIYPVSQDVNKPTNDYSDLIKKTTKD